MDSEVRGDQSMEGENSSQNSMKKAKEDAVELQTQSIVAADVGAPLGPITPDSNTESGDFLVDFTSPLTLVSSPLKAVCFDSHQNIERHASIDNSPYTPKQGVFDPFAPGPDKLMLAPHCNKYLEESQSNVARQLNFDASVKFFADGNPGNDAESISEEEIFLETVYGTLLEVIVSKQTEELLAEISPLDSGSNGFKTPTSAPCLNGIAETCPRAPMKPTKKFRSIDQGLCRKLEF